MDISLMCLLLKTLKYFLCYNGQYLMTFVVQFLTQPQGGAYIVAHYSLYIDGYIVVTPS